MQEARQRQRRNSSRCLFFFRACREDSNILLFPSTNSFSQRQMLLICNSTEENSLHKSRIRHRNCLWKFWEKITIAESHVHRIGRSTHTQERGREGDTDLCQSEIWQQSFYEGKKDGRREKKKKKNTECDTAFHHQSGIWQQSFYYEEKKNPGCKQQQEVDGEQKWRSSRGRCSEGSQ